MKMLFTLALMSLMLTSQSLVAQSSPNRFSDWQINEMNKAMKVRAAAEAKSVQQDRPTNQLKESSKDSDPMTPDSISGAKKKITEIDQELQRNSMGLESAHDRHASDGDMVAKYGPDWATSKSAQTKIEMDSLEKKGRLSKQKIELHQRRAVLLQYLSSCKVRVGECKP